MPISSAICSVLRIAQVAAEPELRGGGDAVDRLRAALAQVDLVEVGLEDRALVVARLDQQRVQDLVELAATASASLPMPSRPLRASCWVSVLAPCLASPGRTLTRTPRAACRRGRCRGGVLKSRSSTACRPVTSSSGTSSMRTSRRSSCFWPYSVAMRAGSSLAGLDRAACARHRARWRRGRRTARPRCVLAADWRRRHR